MTTQDTHTEATAWRRQTFSVAHYGDTDRDAPAHFDTATAALATVRRTIVGQGNAYVEWHDTVHRERWSAGVGFHRAHDQSLDFVSTQWTSDPRTLDGEGMHQASIECTQSFDDGYAEMVSGCAATGDSPATAWLSARLAELDGTVAGIRARDPRPAILGCAPRPARKPVRMLMRCAHEFYDDSIPRWTGLDDRTAVEEIIAERLRAIMAEAGNDPAEITVHFERSLRRGGATPMLSAGVRSNRVRVPEERAMREGHNDVTGTADRTTTEPSIAAGWIVDDLVAGGYA